MHSQLSGWPGVREVGRTEENGGEEGKVGPSQSGSLLHVPAPFLSPPLVPHLHPPLGLWDALFFHIPKIFLPHKVPPGSSLSKRPPLSLSPSSFLHTPPPRQPPFIYIYSKNIGEKVSVLRELTAGAEAASPTERAVVWAQEGSGSSPRTSQMNPFSSSNPAFAGRFPAWGPLLLLLSTRPTPTFSALPLRSLSWLPSTPSLPPPLGDWLGLTWPPNPAFHLSRHLLPR